MQILFNKVIVVYWMEKCGGTKFKSLLTYVICISFSHLKKRMGKGFKKGHKFDRLTQTGFSQRSYLKRATLFFFSKF